MKKNEAGSIPTCYGGVHPALKTSFGYSFIKAAMKYRSMLSQELEKHKLVTAHIGILKLLNLFGPASQIGLGQDMGIDKASMVKFIDGLEKMKWVRRLPDKIDRRIKLVEITPKGSDGLKKILELHSRVTEEFLSPLPAKERKALHEVLNKLT
ncbi:MAG: hypothetical protein OM95_11870 [Bdellovibrio sp. ArHS]|uniref:MarR family winged helix-turn-helix transcriptional regulator n=1 Tax=Bdellovibrio sp. ArHS TaxID=1569284 RepID=UPI0005837937|nr:MarR family transcriptional regulator [Bdellovibrio sp. ArHS]KHD87953.1 MAG: hypothetical protein OM95_11870 [Bdellovibrio sp. ArHS]